MSAEADLRALLVANAALVALVPVARITIDAVDQAAPRPYIVLSKQSSTPTFGLDNSLLAEAVDIDIQCVGTRRAQAIAVREAVQVALLAGGQPWAGTSAGYDAENDIEAEVVSVNWLI